MPALLAFARMAARPWPPQPAPRAGPVTCPRPLPPFFQQLPCTTIYAWTANPEARPYWWGRQGPAAAPATRMPRAGDGSLRVPETRAQLLPALQCRPRTRTCQTCRRRRRPCLSRSCDEVWLPHFEFINVRGFSQVGTPEKKTRPSSIDVFRRATLPRRARAAQARALLLGEADAPTAARLPLAVAGPSGALRHPLAQRPIQRCGWVVGPHSGGCWVLAGRCWGAGGAWGRRLQPLPLLLPLPSSPPPYTSLPLRPPHLPSIGPAGRALRPFVSPGLHANKTCAHPCGPQGEFYTPLQFRSFPFDK